MPSHRIFLVLLTAFFVLLPLSAGGEDYQKIPPLERLLKSGKFEKQNLPPISADLQASPDYLALFDDVEGAKNAIVWLASHLDDFDSTRIGSEQFRNFILMHYPLGRTNRDHFDLIVYMPRPQTKELASLGLLLEIQELIPPPSQIANSKEVALPDHTGSLIKVRDGRCFLQIPSAEEAIVFIHSNECRDPEVLVQSARELNLTRFKAKITY